MTNFIKTLIDANPVLSEAAVSKLCYKMHNSTNEKERLECRDKLALSFSKYAYSVCNQQFLKGNISEEDIEDMFNDILEVILEKACEFNPDSSSKACFITFITPYVQNKVLKSFNGEKTEYYVRTMNTINRAVAAYFETYKEQPSLEELSEITGFSIKKIKNACLMKNNYMTVSIYDTAFESDYGVVTYGDIATGNATSRVRSYTPEDTLYGKELNEKLILGMQELTPVEKFTIDNFHLSVREGVRVLEEEYGIVMGKTAYAEHRKTAVRKLRDFMGMDPMESVEL